MKKAELNKIFTAKVNELLAQGYTFHTETMAGHQGEIAKVDLTNGEEVIRILLEDGPVWAGIHYNKVYSIKVGRATELSWDYTIWNNKLEILDQEDYYSTSGYGKSDWLVSKEEAKANKEKNHSRWEAKRDSYTFTDCTDKTTIKALLPYLNKKSGCKSVKARHITEVEKQTNSDGSFVYHITIQKKDKVKVELFNSRTLKEMRGAC